MICGFLDLKGNLFSCARYEHTSKATELVSDLNIKRVKPFDTCEDVLLHNGWICIRMTDVYKAIYDYDGKILFISEEQQAFFKKHEADFTERQLVDIYGLLKDFGQLYKWHKEERP